jgi:polyisoprenoid-binding protein YceI
MNLFQHIGYAKTRSRSVGRISRVVRPQATSDARDGLRIRRVRGLMLAALAFVAPAAMADPDSYDIDPTHTVVAFLIDHIGFSRVLGRFDDVEGSFTYDPDSLELSDLVITVQTASVSSGNKARDNHVRKNDFLGVKDHPTMQFKVDSAVLPSADGGTIEGTLTLLGKTLPLMLDVQVNKTAVYPFGHKKLTIGVSAQGSLMRSEYGMTYGVANALVGDEVEMIIETEAVIR